MQKEEANELSAEFEQPSIVVVAMLLVLLLVLLVAAVHIGVATPQKCETK